MAKICKTHPGKEFKLREGGKNGSFYSHIINQAGDNKDFSNWHSVWDIAQIGGEIIPEDETMADMAKEPIRERLEQPKADWGAIANGKVRHGFAIEAFKMGKPLDDETKAEIEAWTAFVMGK